MRMHSIMLRARSRNRIQNVHKRHAGMYHDHALSALAPGYAMTTPLVPNTPFSPNTPAHSEVALVRFQCPKLWCSFTSFHISSCRDCKGGPVLR